MSIYIQYEGVKGNIDDPGHKQWLKAEKLSWTTTRAINAKEGGGRAAGNANVGAITIHRRMDSGSTSLFVDSCVGTGKKVIIHLAKSGAGKGSDVYMQYTLLEALLTQYSVIAEGDSSALPMEVITISFVDVEMKYTPYDDKNKAGASVAVGYNLKSNESR